MKRNWTTDELIDHWTLLPDEYTFVMGVHTEPHQLGLALLLKSFQYLGRFPHAPVDIPASVLDFVARQLSIDGQAFAAYDWGSRTMERHRSLIRHRLGFHPATTREATMVATWLQQHVLPHQRNLDALKHAFYARCRTLHLEPPTPARVERLLRSAVRTYEHTFCALINQRLDPMTRHHLDALLVVAADDGGSDTLDGDSLRFSALQHLKTDTGALSVERVIAEGEKLQRIGQIALPESLFHGIPFKIVEGYRQRVGAEDLPALRRHPPAIRYTLLAAFCWVRGQEITDTLVDLLIDLIHRIAARAEKQVDTKLLQDLKRVKGKTRVLYEVAHASLIRPSGLVHEVVYPAAGGEQTLQKIVEEWQAHGSYERQVQTTMHGSYRHHYRRIIPVILRLLTFQSNNTLYQPIMTALQVLRRYADVSPKRVYYASDDDVPLDGVIPKAWRPLVLHTDRGKTYIKRVAYELGVLQTIREKVRCKELWVAGAKKYRNPDDDLPADFHAARDTYYADLQLPLDVEAFIVREQAAMKAALDQFNQTIVQNHKVKLTTRHSKSWIKLSPLDPQPEARTLQRLKAEVGRRWRWTHLMDMVKETDLRTRFTDCFQTIAAHENLDRAIIQKRLLLCLYGLGTNMGLKRVSAGDHGEAYRELLYTLRRYITKDQVRAAIAQIVNATLHVRNPAIWGEGTTACASDSKKMSAWDQNLLTEWHIRYRGPGIMVYWHVEKKSLCVYSQVKSCSSSEVAAMIEGVLRHCTDMTVEKNYVDSHGQSEVGFAFCSLLGFQLLPRLKAIGSQKLYRPEAGTPEAYANLQPILTRPINWELIRQQYDELIKYTTALRLGTAEADAILRRFTRNGPQHPTYQALAEYGKVRKTIFLCDYLQSDALRQEIHDGLNTVENWNSAISFIFYGKGGEIATNHRDDQERAVLAMHLLQVCLVYINTLMVQQVFTDPTWFTQFQARDFQALHPLFYNHVNPYGEVRLNMQERIALDHAA